MIDAEGGGGAGRWGWGWREGFMWLASGSCQRVSEVSSSIWSHYHVKGRGRCLEEASRQGEESSRIPSAYYKLIY